MVETPSFETQHPMFIPMVQASLVPNDPSNNDGYGEQEISIIQAETVGGQGAMVPEPSPAFELNTSTSSSSTDTSSSSWTTPSLTLSSSVPVHNNDGTHRRSVVINNRSMDHEQQQHHHHSNRHSLPGESYDNRNGNSNTNNNNNPQPDVLDNNVTLAAGAAGCVLGLITGGGVVWIILCGSVLAHMSTQDGTAGDVSRAVGDVALTARRNFQTVDNKHHIVDKTKRFVSNALSYIQLQIKKVEDHDPDTDAFLRLDGKAKMKCIGRWTWKMMGELERKHNLIARGTVQLKALARTTYEIAAKVFTSMCQERRQD